jgi:hypothetical protein
MNGFRKYFIVLLITAGIFAIAYFASTYFNNQKIIELQQAQEQATVDVLSSQTQFDLLESQSCQDVSSNYLSQELSDLADKITYAEQNLNDQTQLTLLKQQYSILEVKDFLLTKQVSERCKTPVATILYFYKADTSCTDCTKQGYVLDALRQTYSTVRALLTIYKIPTTLPAIVIDDTTEDGFMSIDAIEKELPTAITNPPATPTDSTAANPSISNTAN